MQRLFAVIVLILVVATSAPLRAQGPGVTSAVTPAGSRIGIAPLAGMTESDDFTGFADKQTGASVVFAEMPPEAWPQMRDGLTAQALRQRGIQEMARSTFRTAAGDALLIEGVQGSGATSIGKYMMVFPGPGFTGMVTVNLTPAAADRYAHADVRAMLATTMAVATPTISARDALTFTFVETPRLKLLQTLGRQAAVLRQTPPPGPPAQAAAAVVSTARLDAVPADRVAFATRVLGQVEQLVDVTVTESQPRTIGPHAAIEQRATGKDRRSGNPVSIYHLLIAEDTRVLRVVAFVEIATAESWLPEFRALADSVRLR
ncbi:MAG: hypothetical protein JNK67_32095 [Alphaproteobacteria bacterium]|nr:hypothetical protein [Alphaproteobacteria bacterium]